LQFATFSYSPHLLAKTNQLTSTEPE